MAADPNSSESVFLELNTFNRTLNNLHSGNVGGGGSDKIFFRLSSHNTSVHEKPIGTCVASPEVKSCPLERENALGR
jgi:hypothetical protein